MTARLPLTLLAASSFVLAAGPARAQFILKPNTTEIREVWEAVIRTPDPAADGPQIFTYMSPKADTSGRYLWLLINVRDNPFRGGGIQLQAWDHANAFYGSTEWGTAKLSTAGETIRWSQSMKISVGQGKLTLGIPELSSTSLGSFSNFGGPPSITLPLGATLRDFSAYHPATSASYARVGWQRDRVASLKIVEVRQYNDNGTCIDIHTNQYPVDLSD